MNVTLDLDRQPRRPGRDRVHAEPVEPIAGRARPSGMDGRSPLHQLALALAAALALSGCTPLLGGPDVARTRVPAPDAPIATGDARQLVAEWADDLGARIEFGEDGTLSGSDGCNSIVDGRWRPLGSDAIALQYGTTERRCVRPPSLALSDTMTWQRTVDTLVLTTRGGTESTLQRRGTCTAQLCS